MKSSGKGVVYSTDQGRTCPECGKPLAGCVCKQRTIPDGNGPVMISRETKGRKGAGVTVVAGIPLDDEGLNALAKTLKQRCGVGGAIKAGVIELQGDQRDKVAQALAAYGWVIKRKGG